MIKITVKTNDFGEEFVSSIMWERGALGVNIVNSRDIADLYKSDVIWDYIDENLLKTTELVVVDGFFEDESALKLIPFIEQDILDVEKRSGESLGTKEISLSEVADVDWVSEWKKYYKALEISDIAVVPSWQKYENKEGKKVVLISPGAAFGTGEHETTRMCLEYISEMDIDGKTVIDAGTGSGILAIAAEKFGAKSVLAFDIDSDAIKVAKENGALNNSNVDFEVLNAFETELEKTDIIFANITADILKAFAPIFARTLNDGGTLVLSGIIDERYDEVIKTYTDIGFKQEDHKRLGEWHALKLSK